jgi:hypothetical protein
MTFDNVLDAVSELPFEQQESLVDIIKSRMNDSVRKRIANDAKISISEFENQKYKAETAEELINRLNSNLE